MKKLYLFAVFLTVLSCSNIYVAKTQAVEVKGRVLSEDDTGIQEVTVSLEKVNKSEKTYSHVTTDVDGNYEFIYLTTISWEESAVGGDPSNVKCVTHIQLKYSKDGYKTQLVDFEFDKNKIIDKYISKNDDTADIVDKDITLKKE